MSQPIGSNNVEYNDLAKAFANCSNTRNEQLQVIVQRLTLTERNLITDWNDPKTTNDVNTIQAKHLLITKINSNNLPKSSPTYWLQKVFARIFRSVPKASEHAEIIANNITLRNAKDITDQTVALSAAFNKLSPRSTYENSLDVFEKAKALQEKTNSCELEFNRNKSLVNYSEGSMKFVNPHATGDLSNQMTFSIRVARNAISDAKKALEDYVTVRTKAQLQPGVTRLEDYQKNNLELMLTELKSFPTLFD